MAPVGEFCVFNIFLINLTLTSAFLTSLHVASMYSGFLVCTSNFLTKPKPIPRLQPVINIEFIVCFVIELHDKFYDLSQFTNITKVLSAFTS